MRKGKTHEIENTTLNCAGNASLNEHPSKRIEKYFSTVIMSIKTSTPESLIRRGGD